MMRYHLVALFTIFVWGTTFVSTKVLLESLSPLWILLLRFAIGFMVLCALRPYILRLQEPKHEALFIAAGFTGIAAYYLLENIVLVFTTATAVGVIVAASPLFTALLLAARGDRSSINVRFFAGFVLAMAGLVLVGIGAEPGGEPVALQALFGEGSLFGDILALLAALVWAVYSVLVQKIAELGYETVASTKRTFLWGLVVIVPLTILFGGDSLAGSSGGVLLGASIAIPFASEALFRLDTVLNLLFLGVIASAACFVTWGVSVKHLGPTTSTTYIYLVPAITACASIVILSEPLNAAIVIGALMTIAGLFLSQQRTTQQQ